TADHASLRSRDAGNAPCGDKARHRHERRRVLVGRRLRDRAARWAGPEALRLLANSCRSVYGGRTRRFLARQRGDDRCVGARLERTRRALHVMRVARRSGGRRVLAELGVAGRRDATREGARRFREALEELGTTYVKLGQLLSSRPDLLPDVYIEELAHLVDEVPPVPFVDIDATIRAELGDDVFASIDPEPLAAASIAQTRRALLKSGREVVIKV